MGKSFTDESLARQVEELASAIHNLGDDLTLRQYDGSRCNCNAWGKPGMCGHHSYAYNQMREAALKLGAVVDYLRKK